MAGYGVYRLVFVLVSTLDKGIYASGMIGGRNLFGA